MFGPKLDIEEFRPIIRLFEEDRGYELFAIMDMNRLIIRDELHNIILMIRFNPTIHKMIIANIEFVHQRQGHGSQLLSILKAYGHENGYEKIEVESLLSEAIYEFVKKHGFTRKNNGCPPEIYGDWELYLTT